MSQEQDEIIVDFDFGKKEINNDVIEDVKPKAKRASKKHNVVVSEDFNLQNVPEVEESVEPVEDVKPKAKRAINKNNTVIEDVKPVEDIKSVEPVEGPVEPKNIKTLEMVQCDKCNKNMTKTH